MGSDRAEVGLGGAEGESGGTEVGIRREGVAGDAEGLTG
jgi:hypothetical protein